MARKVTDKRTIVAGQLFDTPVETGCVATTNSDQWGNFLATDSDGVGCSFTMTPDFVLRVRDGS